MIIFVIVVAETVRIRFFVTFVLVYVSQLTNHNSKFHFAEIRWH